MTSTRFPAHLRIIGANATAPAFERRACGETGAAAAGGRLRAGAPGIMTRDGLLAHLAVVGELAPEAPLSFVVVKVFGLGELNRERGWRACETVLAAVGGELRDLTRATDAVGRLSGSTFGIVLQGTGATAAAAVEARLNYRLNRLSELPRPAQMVVSAATGTGVDAETLPIAAMDSFDEDAV